ncbi:MAG: radical SAM family heme chaperone HemW, partial [Rickettsiales bacterium]|nr:radical SAM family heme chaperone HemW [Rickettsiales bacterium]
LGSIFFGGGTPSLMPPSTAAALIDSAAKLFSFSPDIEITLEANPTSVEAETFPAFKAAGINRVSLGVQSLDDKELAFLGRAHSSTEALKAVERASQHFPRYSFDLIYARPNHTVEAWEAELTRALSYAGKHLSLYQLTIEENTAFHHAYARHAFTLPNEEQAESLYRATESLMAAHGFTAYEVSNYAHTGEESRHNLAYWKGTDYLGIGPGAHGRLTLNGKRIATQTLKSPERWLEKTTRDQNGIEEWRDIPRAEEAEERLMMGLRLKEGLNYADFQTHTGFDLRDYLDAHKIALHTRNGLLHNSATKLQTTLNGRLLLGTLTADLLKN